MPKFRKKPVVIDAVLWDGSNVREVYSFMHGAPTISGNIAHDKWDDFVRMHEGKPWMISTLEAKEHEVSVGDWIIKGVRGEHYSCKPEIFQATYEPAEKAGAA